MNPRQSAWKADALPLSYTRLYIHCTYNYTTPLIPRVSGLPGFHAKARPPTAAAFPANVRHSASAKSGERIRRFRIESFDSTTSLPELVKLYLGATNSCRKLSSRGSFTALVASQSFTEMC